MTGLTSLESRFGHTFADKALLDLALTHRSMTADAPTGGAQATNERLEFLGDRVLGLAMAHLLLETFPEESEGQLAQRFAALVSAKTLKIVARNVDLGPHIKIGTGMTMADAIEANACEALIGAVYLDADFATAQAVVLRHWQPLVEAASNPPKDAKTTLQEWVQERGMPLPRYDIVDQTGPDHAPVFTMTVTIDGHEPAQGKGPSKRIAAQAAAQALISTLP